MARSLCLIITPVSLLKHESGFVMFSLLKGESFHCSTRPRFKKLHSRLGMSTKIWGDPKRKKTWLKPIASIKIWLILMVHVGESTLHGWYGYVIAVFCWNVSRESSKVHSVLLLLGLFGAVVFRWTFCFFCFSGCRGVMNKLMMLKIEVVYLTLTLFYMRKMSQKKSYV